MRWALVLGSVAWVLASWARQPAPAPLPPPCVQAGPYSVLGHQVVPYVYQCLP